MSGPRSWLARPGFDSRSVGTLKCVSSVSGPGPGSRGVQGVQLLVEAQEQELPEVCEPLDFVRKMLCIAYLLRVLKVPVTQRGLRSPPPHPVPP